MKPIAIASLAIVASLSLTGCASDKYYDLGFKIGSSENFVDAFIRQKAQNPYMTINGTYFESICRNYFNMYVKETDSSDFLLTTSNEFISLLNGCRAGYTDAQRP